MKKINHRNRLLIIAGCVVLCSIILILFSFGSKKEERQKVGFVMSGSKDEIGWNGIHYLAIEEACKKWDMELLCKENVKEFSGECERAVQELANEGAGMIVLSSYGYSEEMKDIVTQYPEITFYGNSSEYHATNMTSYFARMYQARYLTGIIAGMKTESNVIGYVAAMENNEVNRGINAFTLGVKRVNKDAKVIVSWTGQWDAKEDEIEAVHLLVNEAGADVITYHQNQDYVLQEADALGIASIGYHHAYEDYTEKYLTSAVFNWEPVYEELVKEYLKEKGNTHKNFWIGIEKEAVMLSDFSPEITDAIKREVEKAKSEIVSGKDVFSGVIVDAHGNERCGENEIISDEILLEQMDWFVEGVEFYGE